jgi:endoglucanase
MSEQSNTRAGGNANGENGDHVFDVVSAFSAVPGPSGHEEPVRAFLRERWQSRMADWQEDRVGNVLCRVGGSGPKLLIQAHMDEIGFVVRAVTDAGFLLLDNAQGSRRMSPDRRQMIGQLAQVLGRDGVVAEGVFATASGHVMTQEQLDKPHLDFNDFFIDIGARNRQEVEARGIHIGSPVIWNWPCRRFGSRIAGKAMDDRMLLAVMDLLLDDLDIDAVRYDLWFGATIQEENGLHGARAMAHTTNFDYMIALDVGLVGDIPAISEAEFVAKLGDGPTLVHKDRDVHYNQPLLWRLADVAQAHDIPFQHGVYTNYCSDGMPFIDHGTPAVLIGVPTRYTHTAFEMIDDSDVTATVALLGAFVTTAPGS